MILLDYLLHQRLMGLHCHWQYGIGTDKPNLVRLDCMQAYIF
nr:MAG TPA: hypothetical protein [Crassvirales sp.]